MRGVWSTLAAMHREHPTLWIVHLAPMVLAAAGWFVGRSTQQMATRTLELERAVDARTAELAAALEIERRALATLEADEVLLREQHDRLVAQRNEVEAQHAELERQHRVVVEQAAELLRLSMVVAQVQDAIVVTDATGNITWVNEAWSRVTGYPATDAIGKRPGALLHGARTSDETTARMRASVRAGRPFEAEVLNYRRDGAEFWMEVRASPVRDAGGAITSFVAIERDVTERRAEERLRQQLATAVGVSPDGIGVTSVAGGWEYANEAQARMFGYTHAESMLGRPWRECYAEPDAARLEREAIPDVARLGSWQGEVQAIRRDGHSFPQELSITLLPLGGLVCVSRDISDRKTQQAALERLSLHDELTGILNRRGFFEQADRQLQLASRARVPCVLLYGDLDDFKPINDVYGHGAGDAALAAVGRSLREVFRESDLVARLGGDEFAVLAMGATDEAMPELQRRLVERLAANTPTTSQGIALIRLAMSIGFVVAGPDDGRTAAVLLREADARQYEMKEQRKGERKARGQIRDVDEHF